jgi:hypothetical protein
MPIIHHEQSAYRICQLLAVHSLLHKSIHITMCIEFGIFCLCAVEHSSCGRTAGANCYQLGP